MPIRAQGLRVAATVRTGSHPEDACRRDTARVAVRARQRLRRQWENGPSERHTHTLAKSKCSSLNADWCNANAEGRTGAA